MVQGSEFMVHGSGVRVDSFPSTHTHSPSDSLFPESCIFSTEKCKLERERTFIEFMTSERKLRASREGSKRRIYGT